MRNSSPTRERLVLECILWKLANGTAWYDFPEAYPFWSETPECREGKTHLSHQTIYRRYRKWRRNGLLHRVLSTLTADLQTRRGFDIAEALSSGLIQLERDHRKKLKVTIHPDQNATWKLLTALLLIGIAARRS